jgi:hypothetical protein
MGGGCEETGDREMKAENGKSTDVFAMSSSRNEASYTSRRNSILGPGTPIGSK